jgi:hypothetical protein
MIVDMACKKSMLRVADLHTAIVGNIHRATSRRSAIASVVPAVAGKSAIAPGFDHGP